MCQHFFHYCRLSSYLKIHIDKDVSNQSLLYSIFGAFGSMVGKIFGLGLCNSCHFSASLLGIMLLSFLPLQVMYFRALQHSLGYIFSIYFSFFDDIEYYMHHVQLDCNRVLEVRRGLVVFTVQVSSTG